MEKNDFEQILNDLEENKKKPSEEEIQAYEKNWITFAKENQFSLDAQEILLNSLNKFNSSKFLYDYICGEIDRVSILKEFLENKSKKKDKSSFSKVVFGLLAFMVTSKDIDQDTIGHFFYESINTIKSDKDSKKSAFRYLAKYFAPNLPEKPAFANFDKFGLVLYASSSLIQICLEFVDEIEKNEIKIPEENQKKLTSFKVWLLDSKKKIGDAIVESSAESKKKADEEKERVAAEKKEAAKKIKIEDTDEYKKLKEAKEDIDAELTAANGKISNLENKVCSLNYDIRNLNNQINEKNNQIDVLNTKIAEQKQITSIVSKDESQKVKETYQQLANKLNYDYSTFKEAKEVEMSNELGDLFKEQLSNVFNILKDFGINLE